MRTIGCVFKQLKSYIGAYETNIGCILIMNNSIYLHNHLINNPLLKAVCVMIHSGVWSREDVAAVGMQGLHSMWEIPAHSGRQQGGPAILFDSPFFVLQWGSYA